MALKLYLDQQVPRVIATTLRARGIEVVTAFEDRSSELADEALLDRATEIGYVLFTRDKDFLIEGNRRQQAGEPFHGVIYAHQLLVPISTCIRDLEIIANIGEEADVLNMVLHLPL